MSEERKVPESERQWEKGYKKGVDDTLEIVTQAMNVQGGGAVLKKLRELHETIVLKLVERR